MKLLIGYDGTGYSEAAVLDLHLAGLPDDCEVTVLNANERLEQALVIDRARAATASVVHEFEAERQLELEAIVGDARRVAEAGAELILREFPNWKVEPVGVAGDPAGALIREATVRQPDLVIVGSQGRSALGRLFFGSVSKSVLDHAGVSVRIARQSDRKAMAAPRILAAVDGSPDSEIMLREISNRRWPEGTEIRLIAVDDPLKRSDDGYVIWNFEHDRPEENARSREWTHRVITIPIQNLQAFGIKAFGVIRWGDAGNIILQEADEWNADAIFLGARGLGRFKRFLLGSVSSFVAARAACTVEVVRERQIEPEEEPTS